MNEQFYTILTQIGKAKIANATALGTKINIVKFHVGDGNGSYYNPTEEQTQLKNKLWEGNISSIRVDDENPNWIILEAVIPGSDGGFMVREVGAVDSDGNLIAIGKFPETYKPIAGDGSIKDLILKMVLEVSNASSVTLKIDPTVILANKKDILDLEEKVNDLENSISKMELTSTKVTRPNGKTVETSLSEHDREIESLKLSVSSGKKEVASAITDKGVPTLATDTFKTMSDNIREIVSYSDLSIKISAQVDEPLEPKDGDLWLVTDVEPSKIVLSCDVTKIKREENAIFVKLKFLDMICNFNDTMASLLEIPNQTIIDYKKGEKRSEIRGVGIAKGGVIDLYADFSFAKMYSNSEFKLLPIKYFYNGEWITVDNGFDYIYIVRDGNIALFNPNSNSVVWQISRTMDKNPAFCINNEGELLVQGMPSVKINKVTKGGEVVELPFYDSDYIAYYYCLGVMEDEYRNILFAYPLNSSNYTRFVKLNKDGQKIFQVDEEDRVLSSYRYGANRYYISSGTIINENSEFAIVYYYWENGQKSTHAKFFDSSGKRVKYNSNFFTLTSDHYIRKIKRSKTGEVFALAYLKGDRDHITTKCMILKYDSYDMFKAGKISKRIGLPNFLLADDFHITDDNKIVLIQYTINSNKKIITIDTKTMQIISEVISNIPEKTYAYTVTRDGRCITNSHIISQNGSITPINGLSNISNGSTDVNDYRCLNSVTESNFE